MKKSNKTSSPKKNDSANSYERIAKRIAHAGICSRRDAEKLIEEGKVLINNQLCTEPGTKVCADDHIVVNGRALRAKPSLSLVLFHKPNGLIVSQSDEKDRPTIFSILPRKYRKFNPVGRLDMMTEGLLLLTNDGEFKRYLEHPNQKFLRRYHVRVYGHTTIEQLKQIQKGIRIDGVNYKPDRIKPIKPLSHKPSNFWLEIDLREGKNREIRNIMAFLDLKISKLNRISYGPIQLGNIPLGECEAIHPDDIKDLFPEYIKSQK